MGHVGRHSMTMTPNMTKLTQNVDPQYVSSTSVIAPSSLDSPLGNSHSSVWRPNTISLENKRFANDGPTERLIQRSAQVMSALCEHQRWVQSESPELMFNFLLLVQSLFHMIILGGEWRVLIAFYFGYPNVHQLMQGGSNIFCNECACVYFI